MKKQCYNKLYLTAIPVKQKDPIFKKKGEYSVGTNFVIKPDYIKIYQDEMTVDVYKRIKDSAYWKCVGLPGYEFALIVHLSI